MLFMFTNRPKILFLLVSKVFAMTDILIILISQHTESRVTIFSLLKRTGSLKVITSADAKFPPQNQVKSKKGHRVRRPGLK